MNILFIGLLFGIIGILQMLYPEKVYMLGRNWMYKEYELSEIGKLFVRVAGLILVWFSIYCFWSVYSVFLK
jgi:hypothetical protein